MRLGVRELHASEVHVVGSSEYLWREKTVERVLAASGMPTGLFADVLTRIDLSEQAGAAPQDLGKDQRRRLAIVCSFFKKAQVLFYDKPFADLSNPWISDLAEMMLETARNVLPVVAAVAIAGMLIGVLTLTGMALKLSGLILDAGGDSLLLVLLLTMVASFVLGLGMPTSAAYLLLAILIAPALERFGLPIIAAHMFIFYYGLLSAITPPVALAAYAGASIAGAGPNETAFESIRLGFVKVVAPFLFVYAPELLLIGTPAGIVLATVAAFTAVFAAGTAMTGWCIRPLGIAAVAGLWFAAALLVTALVLPVGGGPSLAFEAAGCLLTAWIVVSAWRRNADRTAHLAP